MFGDPDSVTDEIKTKIGLLGTRRSLISVSEKRRSFTRVKQLGRNSRTEAIAYYKSFVNLVDLMKQNNTSLYRQPLFQWDNHGSNSFLYEQLNLEHTISLECFDAAINTTDLKEKRSLVEGSVRYARLALNTLQSYEWDDVSLKYLR